MTREKNCMKSKRILFLLFQMVLGFSLMASSYPDVSLPDGLDRPVSPALDVTRLEEFIVDWQSDVHPSLKEVSEALKDALLNKKDDLAQLQSLYRMQEAQLSYLQKEQGFKFALASSPMYSYGESAAFSSGSLVLRRSHTLGLGATLSKQLPTAGTVSLQVKQTSSYGVSDPPGGDWAWTHTPSVSLSLLQPLGVGENLLDGSYQKKQREKQNLSLQEVQLSSEELLQALLIQGSSQLVVLQALLESRFIVSEQLILENESLKDAQDDLKKGRISQNAYEQRQYVVSQLQYNLSEIEYQIASTEASLELLWGNQTYPRQFSLHGLEFLQLEKIYNDKENFLMEYLQTDPSYQKALGKIRSAQIDETLMNPADAPVFSLSMQYSPFYAGTAGNTFFGSYEEMVSSSDPVFSVSIGFSASDVSRNASMVSKSLAEEGLYQATKEAEIMKKEIDTTLEDAERTYKGLLASLGVGLLDYQMQDNAVEVETIRASVGLANESSIRMKELERYAAAFTLLQTIRELELLQLQMESL